MPATDDQPQPSDLARPPPWYVANFDARYLDRYAHRDGAEAAHAVRHLLPRLDLPDAARVLDLACGAGRHVQPLLEARPAAVVMALDLSPDLIAAAGRSLARERAAGRVQLVRADMRSLPFPSGTRDMGFDAVVSFFTSFGYFETIDEDIRVLAEVLRVLREGGRLALDFLNREHVAATLVEHEQRIETEPDGRRTEVTIDRKLDRRSRRLTKRVQFRSLADPPAPLEVYEESVRAYEPLELQAMIADTGFTITDVLGDYDGNRLATTSPRCIVVGEKPCSR